MHAAVHHVAILTHLLLLGALAVHAVRSRDLAARTLALEALSVVIVPLLGITAVFRREAGYLDVAIVVALLGFVQTVAIARIAERRRELS